MMRPITRFIVATTLLAQLIPLSAVAAPRNLSLRLTALATPLEAIKLPQLGKLGDVSIGTLGELPGLSAIKVPLFGTLSGLPEIGTLKISDGLGLIESTSVLQNPLAGFKLGTISTVLRP